MDRRVIITGGLGFLGQHLVRMLAKDGRFEPVVLDNFGASAEADLAGGGRVFTVDIRDEEATSRVFSEVSPGFVVHAAAQLPRSKPEEIRSTTVDGTANILRLADRFGVERTLFISSTAVYPQAGGEPHREDAKNLVGFGPYGRAKIEAERLCADARAAGRIVPVIRPKTFVGTGRMGIFQMLFRWILEGRKIPLIGAGENRFQLLEVQDLCAAIMLVLTAPPEDINKVFNVGATEYGTVRSDLAALCAHAGTGSKPVSIPVGPTFAVLSALHKLGLSPIYPWVFRTAVTNSEVHVDRISSLGWQAEFSNEACLMQAYDWYRDHGVQMAVEGSATGHRAPWSQGALGLVRYLF